MSNDNQYIEKRKEKIRSLRDMGIDPFSNKYDRENSVEDILSKYSGTSPSSFKPDNLIFKIAGRVTAIRSFGKSAFIKIIDNMHKIQIFISNDSVGKEKMDFFKKYVDVGDFVGIQGHAFFTRTEELSLEANHLQLLTKSINK